MPRAPKYKKGYHQGTPTVSAATYQQIIGHLIRDTHANFLSSYGKKRSTPYTKNTLMKAPTAKQLAHRARFAEMARNGTLKRLAAAKRGGASPAVSAEAMAEALSHSGGQKRRQEDLGETLAQLLSPASKR